MSAHTYTFDELSSRRNLSPGNHRLVMHKNNSAARRRERKKKLMAKMVAEGVDFDKFRGKGDAPTSTKVYAKLYIKARAALG